MPKVNLSIFSAARETASYAGQTLFRAEPSIICVPVNTIQEIESALTRLSPSDLVSIRDFLDDLIEDELELSDKFKEKVDRAEEQISRGEISRMRTNSSGGRTST